MLTSRTVRSRFLACVAVGGISLAAAGNTFAADCGCGSSYNINPPTAPNITCPCQCACGPKKPNCLTKALDALASGVDKLLHKDRCGCDESVCDDGCDAAMIQDLMSVPASQGHHHHHSNQVTMPPVYSGPTKDVQITPMGPSQWKGAGQPSLDQPQTKLRMSEPHLDDSIGSGQHLGRSAEPIPGEVPPPVRIAPLGDLPEQPVPEPQPEAERGSIFDSLSDPFRDDQTSRTRIYRPVRPSSYDDVELRPISKRPLSRSYSESSRRVSNAR